MPKPQFKRPRSAADNLKAGGKKKRLERHIEVFKSVVPRKLGRKAQKSYAVTLRERARRGDSDSVSQRVSVITSELTVVVQCVLQQPSKLCIYFVCFLKLSLF